MNSQSSKYLLLLHATVLIFGLTGVIGKLVHLPSDILVWYRILIGLAGIILYFIFTRSSFSIGKKDLLKISLVGLILAAHWVTFFEAIHRSNVSVALTCMASSTIFTALFEPLFFKRRIKGYQIILGGIIIYAITLIFSIDLSFKIGIILGVISAALASLFTVLNGVLIRTISAKTITLYQLGAALVFVSIYLFFRVDDVQEFAMHGNDLIYLIVLGLVCTSFAFLASVEVMRKIKPFTVSMVVNLEPIYSILLAIWIWPDTEIMPTKFYYSFALILGAIFMNAFMSRTTSRP